MYLKNTYVVLPYRAAFLSSILSCVRLYAAFVSVFFVVASAAVASPICDFSRRLQLVLLLQLSSKVRILICPFSVCVFFLFLFCPLHANLLLWDFLGCFDMASFVCYIRFRNLSTLDRVSFFRRWWFWLRSFEVQDCRSFLGKARIVTLEMATFVCCIRFQKLCTPDGVSSCCRWWLRFRSFECQGCRVFLDFF